MSDRICKDHAKNFETLSRAFAENNVCIMDCIEKSTGEHVAVICAAQYDQLGNVEFVPFAKFFNGNPYELLESPLEYLGD